MIHTIQQLMDKVSAMHGLAVQAHREKYKSHDGEYDVDKVNTSCRTNTSNGWRYLQR